MNEKESRWIFGICVLLSLPLGAWGEVSVPENIARGKTCVFSRTPSYSLTKDADDVRQLTDGERVRPTGRYMWTDKRAVGWQFCTEPFGITVDLGAVEPIAGFSMDFAAGASGVPYPDAIMVYSSDDGKLWRFVGDLYANSRRENGPPQMNAYETYEANSLKMPTQGRYVCFVPLTGVYFFSSEIAVFRGTAATPAPAKVADPLRHAQSGRIVNCILRDLDRVAPEDEGLRTRVVALADDENLPKAKTILPLNATHAAVWAANARRLRAKGHLRPVLWTNDRWANLDPLTVPDPSVTGRVALAVEMMRGETRSTAVNVLNPTDEPLSCTLSVEGLPSAAAVTCREVLFTDTRLLEPVAGALKPGGGDSIRLEVPAGASKQVWISFARPTVEAGTYGGTVCVRFEGREEVLRGTVGLTVYDLDFPTRPRILLGGWDYSVGKCAYHHAPGNAAANQAMLREIYANVFWAPHVVRPQGAAFDADGALKNAPSLDFGLWDEWVARFPDAARYAVYLDVGGMQAKDGKFVFNGEPVGTARFNRMVAEYFRAWRAHLLACGTDPRKVMFLLVDEPAEWQWRSKELPGLIVAWAKAIKAATPEFVIWEDPDYRENPLQAGREMYDVCDALCPQVLKAASVGKGADENRALFLPLVEDGKEMWLYSCSGPSRTFDPVSYYRQVFWLAYQWQCTGVGFWAFGDGGGIGDSWHAYRQPGVEYSPYFVSPTDVMAAKQSEGIKEGVQDHEYLKMLEDAIAAARKKGIDVAQAEKVLAQAPGMALNQTGKDGRVRYVRADPVAWNAAKDRSSVETARLAVLRALADMMRRP